MPEPAIQERSLPDKLRYVAEQVESGELTPELAAVTLRTIADRADPVRCDTCHLPPDHPRPLKIVPTADFGSFRGGGAMPCDDPCHRAR